MSEAIEYPAPIMRTYMGNLLYDIGNTTEQVHPLNILSQLDVSDVQGKDFKEVSIEKLSLLLRQNRLIFSSRHAASGPPTCVKSGMIFEAAGGRKVISLKDYVLRAKIDHPEIVIAPASEVSLSASEKQKSRSYEQTMTWFKQVKSDLAAHKFTLYGVALCGSVHTVPDHAMSYIDRIVFTAKKLIQDGAKGIVVGGMGLGESLIEMEVSVRVVRRAIPRAIPVVVQGMDSVKQILTALSAGADLVGTNYPSIATQAGLAIVWDLRMTAQRSEAALQPTSHCGAVSGVITAGETRDGRNDDEAGAAISHAMNTSVGDKRRRDSSGSSSGDGDGDSEVNDFSAAVKDGTGTKRPRGDGFPAYEEQRELHSLYEQQDQQQLQYRKECSMAAQSEVPHTIEGDGSIEVEEEVEERGVVNMWDRKHRRDPRPLVVGCTCEACRHHTRAYIHHLLVAHELLGEVLLYRHNQHQVLLLFSRAREVLRGAHTPIAQPDTVDVEIEEADGNSNSEGGSGGGDDYGGNGDNGGDDDSSLVGACGRQLSEESLFLSKQLSDEVEWASADLTGDPISGTTELAGCSSGGNSSGKVQQITAEGENATGCENWDSELFQAWIAGLRAQC